MSNREVRLATLLSEGLDLCVRARKLDEQIMRATEAGMGRIFPESTRCRRFGSKNYTTVISRTGKSGRN